MSKSFFEPIAIKLERAITQHNHIIDSIEKWLNENKIKVRYELREAGLGYRLIQDDFDNPVPLVEWQLLIGEYIHNLRSSLDNLAFALARLCKDPPDNPRKIDFPIFDKKSDFESFLLTKGKQLPINVLNRMEQLQPFQRNGLPNIGNPENDPLMLLCLISNHDKHRIPPLVLFAPTEVNYLNKVQFEDPEIAENNLPPDIEIWSGELNPGVVLIEHRTKNPILSAEVNYNYSATVALVLNKLPIPLNPTITQIGIYVENVIFQFKEFFI